MSDPTTPSKGFDLPATGEYPSAWGPVVNSNFTEIDNSFGGVTTISVTSVAGGTYTMLQSQYQPPNIKFIGVLTANINYLIPGGVGGIWSVLNETTGAFAITFGSSSSSLTLPQGNRTGCTSDGAHMEAFQTPGSGANPTAQVGLIQVDGVLGTFMRSDGAPSLDQSISPTWTGEHIWSAAVEFNGGVALQSHMALSSGAEIDATGGVLECSTAVPGTANQVVASTAFVAASFAPTNSPALTGDPTAPTATPGTNTTQIATTAFALATAVGTLTAANPGYQKFASGLILQWGRSAGGSSPQAVSFPLTFPNACWSIVCTASSGANMNWSVSNPASSTSGFSITASDVDPCSWIAVGN